MYGAIIGDIVGSRFEWNNIKQKDFDLFSKDCFFTDDTVMTAAIADAIVRSDCKLDLLPEYATESMQLIGRTFPDCGYGNLFKSWLFSNDPKPYNSFGNGAAMRVSPCGFSAKTLDEAKMLSYAVTSVTHNHPQGIKGAKAVSVAIFLARKGFSIHQIRSYIHDHYYPLDFSLMEIRPSYFFDETCQNTVPQAIVAFCESSSFEDAIRNAISLGGDSDTLAAITGSIAEAYYGIPRDLLETAKSYIDKDLLEIIEHFYLYLNLKFPS